MKNENILSKITLWKNYEAYNRVLGEKSRKVVSPIESVGNDFFVASLMSLPENAEKNCIYICENDYAARVAFENINALLPSKAVLLERSEYMFYNCLARSEEIDYRRMQAIAGILLEKKNIVVVSAQSFCQYMLPKETIEKSIVGLRVGDDFDITELAERLTNLGYLRVPQIDGKRQFSVRGDIVDIFPTSADNPYRIEFYGDTIDTIRAIDLISQRSVDNVDNITVLGESELQIGLCYNKTYLNDINNALNARLSHTVGAELKAKYKKQIQEETELLQKGMPFPGRDRYVPFIVGCEHNILDYLENPLVFVQNRESVINAVDAVNSEHLKMCESLSDSMCILDELTEFYQSGEAIQNILECKPLPVTFFEKFEDPERDKKLPHKFIFSMKTKQSCSGNEILIRNLLADFYDTGYPVYMFAESSERFDRIVELIENHGNVSNFHFEKGAFSSAFVCDSFGFCVAGESTFYTRKQQKSGTTAKKRGGRTTMETFADIVPGDYIVHDIHGIGIFEGFETRESNGVTKDFAVVKYADNGKLLIPTFSLDSLHKYIGKDDYVPRINTLGGKDWRNQTNKVKKQLNEYVEDLVALYAKRKNTPGFAFQQDSAMQQEFESEFGHEATDDQLTCTEEIKADMESPNPMERLLCGDVGFGKTEVAFRAAFKAVYSGKQVAILCPTTVLCEQHYNTAKERFAKYPVNVDYICRFRTPAQRKDVCEKLEKGKIDIVIGTHSLLAKSTKFKDLGLIIIDEEQRFGVMQKEKLKMNWPGTDILYLSATPIPRTLNMSLTKIRDISLITDPPKSRNPVQTFVLEWDADIIKNAIYREMARHGQVFYLFNRVALMNDKLKELKEIVPEARIAVANGQMPERELENVMREFIAGEYDVLLCSAIIESGIDIPNANTIIVENGHRLGLAQLYQIRGRVGRSDAKAFAYITYPVSLEISDDAEKRLETIKEFTEFGSGFKVAMRDLQIRGAGSVLGERQHGDVAAIGYDMYCKILNDMIILATGGKIPEKQENINIDLAVDSAIPEEYIADKKSRVEIYKKIADIKTEDDKVDVIDELIDRFPGDIPDPVLNIMQLSIMRNLAANCGIKSIRQTDKGANLYIGKAQIFDECLKRNYTRLNKNYRGRFRIMQGNEALYAEFLFSNPGNAIVQKKIVAEIKGLLEVLNGGV